MNEEEFIRHYDALADALFRHCYFRVYERERAKELVQETFTRTWAYLAEGNRIENLRAFLYRVANNLIIDESRRRKAVSLDLLREEGFDPVGQDHRAVEASAGVRELLKFLDRLEARHRHLIIMRYVDDLGPRDIAGIIGESENVVSVRLHRAMKQLRALANHEPRS